MAARPRYGQSLCSPGEHRLPQLASGSALAVLVAASSEIISLLMVFILVGLVLIMGTLDGLVFTNMDRLTVHLDPSSLDVTEAEFGDLLAALAVQLRPIERTSLTHFGHSSSKIFSNASSTTSSHSALVAASLLSYIYSSTFPFRTVAVLSAFNSCVPSFSLVLSEALGVSASLDTIAARHITFSKRDFTELGIMELSYSNCRIGFRLYRGRSPDKILWR